VEPTAKMLVRRLGWFLTLAVTGCLADLLTKYWVFAQPDLFYGSEWWLWEGHVGIQKSLNEGALFGIGQGKVGVFAVLSLLAAGAIPIWLFYFQAARDFWLTTALGCVMGGILGNLYDRLGLSQLTWDNFDPSRMGEQVYAVRDWILVQVNDRLVWPNFNIADALLVLGACMLVIHSLWNNPDTTKESTNS